MKYEIRQVDYKARRTDGGYAPDVWYEDAIGYEVIEVLDSGHSRVVFFKHTREEAQTEVSHLTNCLEGKIPWG